MPKARLGRRERLLRREQWAIFKAVKQAVVKDNLNSTFDPPLLSRDETAQLMCNCHTQGIRIGSQLAKPEDRRRNWQRPTNYTH